ncbi:MAG: hypothetical protein WEC73_05940 [Chthoniobacterales bacterium]
MARRSSNPISDHVRRLQGEQERLMREMAEAEKALRRKPKTARPRAMPERKTRLNSNVAALDLPRPKDHLIRGGVTSQRRPARRRKTDARIAQIKFLLLCLILASIVLFVWKNLPG